MKQNCWKLRKKSEKFTEIIREKIFLQVLKKIKLKMPEIIENFYSP